MQNQRTYAGKCNSEQPARSLAWLLRDSRCLRSGLHRVFPAYRARRPRDYGENATHIFPINGQPSEWTNMPDPNTPAVGVLPTPQNPGQAAISALGPQTTPAQPTVAPAAAPPNPTAP